MSQPWNFESWRRQNDSLRQGIKTGVRNAMRVVKGVLPKFIPKRTSKNRAVSPLNTANPHITVNGNAGASQMISRTATANIANLSANLFDIVTVDADLNDLYTTATLGSHLVINQATGYFVAYKKVTSVALGKFITIPFVAVYDPDNAWTSGIESADRDVIDAILGSFANDRVKIYTFDAQPAYHANTLLTPSDSSEQNIWKAQYTFDFTEFLQMAINADEEVTQLGVSAAQIPKFGLGIATRTGDDGITTTHTGYYIIDNDYIPR
jgi:hypothetical protein